MSDMDFSGAVYPAFSERRLARMAVDGEVQDGTA
jgi:hypothetical protein